MDCKFIAKFAVFITAPKNTIVHVIKLSWKQNVRHHQEPGHPNSNIHNEISGHH